MQEKTIVILANKYPNLVEPNVNVFTQQIAWSFSDHGANCIVICPVAINYNKQNIHIPFYREETAESGRVVKIFHPRYIGLGQDGRFVRKQRVAITTKLYIQAVKKTINKIRPQNPVFFAEFLCPAGVAAAVLGKKWDIPAYMQCGEATYQGDVKYGDKKLKKLLKGLTGVVALSGQNRDFLTDADVVSKEKIIVLPSGYRKDRIYPRDKNEARRRLNLPMDKFIVGFCGSYDERKGVLRLEKAIDMIEDPDVCLAACGRGKLEPTSKKCVLKGPIAHSELAWFYSAVDVFAFPTYHEGSCTAIVEAIACGCPIISSDRSFNYEICDKTNSILIDPNDIEEMKSNILKLKNDDQLRNKLSQGSIEMAKHLSLDDKAAKVLAFMNY